MPVPDLMPALGPQKTWERDKWTARHALACDLHVAGMANNKIAEALDVTEVTVSIWLSDERSHIYIAEKRAKLANRVPDVLTEFEQMLPDVLRVVKEDIMQAAAELGPANRKLRSANAWNVLSSLGYGPMQKRINASVELPADLQQRQSETIDDLREIRSRFAYTAPPSAEVEDGEILGLETIDG